MRPNATNVQSLVAKLLATENITVRHDGSMKTAAFDLKNRVLILPVWEGVSNDLKDMLLGHETAHALDTPSAEAYMKAYTDIAKRVWGDENNTLLTKTVAGFLNIVEDARIDKRQKRRYPGLRKNYLAGYKELFDRDFFGTSGRDINSMSFIDRANIYFKGGSVYLNIEFSPEEKVFLKRMEDAETFKEVEELTEEIYRWTKEKMEGSVTVIGDELVFGEGDEEGDSDDEFSFDSYSDDDSDSEGEGEGDETDSDSCEDEEVNGESDNANPGEDEDESGDKSNEKVSKGAGADKDQKVPEAKTDENYQKRIQELASSSSSNYVYVTFPDPVWKDAVNDYKRVLKDWKGQKYYSDREVDSYRKEFVEWKRKEKEAISFMVAEFERRKSADIYARIATAKTGMLDTNKVHSYKYNDDLFRRHTIIPQGKNHGFVMFIDWSGSMCSDLHHTMKQLFTLILFCRQIQVPFEVYSFKDSNAPHPWVYYGKENCIGLGNVVLRQFLSSKMKTQELNDAMTYLWMMSKGNDLRSDGLSGTPLNEAIILAPKIVKDFQFKNKVEIVNTIFLTDGGANGFNGLKNNGSSSRRKTQYDPLTGLIKSDKYLYTDSETGKTYDIEPFTWYSNEANTSTLLQILKEKTNCNLVGFYLFGDGWSRFSRHFLNGSEGEYLKKAKSFWETNKFYPVKSKGYDEYFVVDTKALQDTKNELVIDPKMTTKKMASIFSKFCAKKSINRVLLRDFVDRISEKTRKGVA